MPLTITAQRDTRSSKARIGLRIYPFGCTNDLSADWTNLLTITLAQLLTSRLVQSLHKLSDSLFVNPKVAVYLRQPETMLSFYEEAFTSPYPNNIEQVAIVFSTLVMTPKGGFFDVGTDSEFL